MDELVKAVVEKTGLPEAQAKMAVETIINFLKEKLPAPLAGQIDVALGNVNADMVGNVLQGLGDLLGKK